ncbi:MAG: hypothetical protein II830_04285, partial [Alphaproteobacteria bacterium]|nr:hypothetical protein [Alphaproteobacteria bacterium]
MTVANAFTNNNSLTVTHGNVVNDITGANGSFTVSNGQVQITDGSLNQKSVIIAAATEGEHPTVRGELTAKIGQIAATNGIENHGKLTLNGSLEDAVNTVAISGNDGALKITGDVINQADITQQTVTVNEDVNFTHNAGTITAGLENGGTLTNEGILKINAESNNEGGILGQGNVIIMANGGIDNNGSFAQKSLTINEDGSFITSLDDLTIADASITNNGEFNLLGGTITNHITGSTGVLGIGGDVILNEGTKINQQNLLVANIPAGEDPAIIGTLTANASDITITGTFTNDNEMTFTGGENNNAITGNGNLIIGGDLTDVEVTNVAGKQIANTVEITAENHLLAQAGDLTNTVTNAGTLTLSGTNVVNAAQIAGNGELVIDGAIQNTDGKTLANTITINANKSLEANAADVLNSVTNEGAFKISGGALGVAVANAADDTTTGTVEITGTDVTLGENGSIKQNKLAIANSGSFAADMQDGKLTVASIENNGAFDVTGDLETAISGTGTLNITDTLENKTNVEQKIITIASNKTFTTNGNNVTASQEITNDGILSLTGGTNNNNITGSGAVEIAGDVINTEGKTITTELSIGEGNSLQANAADIQTGVTNDGTYTVTGGTIGYTVANQAGDTTSGAVIVSGENIVLTEGVALTQKSLTISGGDFTANMAD